MRACIHWLNTVAWAPSAKQERLATNEDLPSSHNQTACSPQTMHVLDWNSFKSSIGFIVNRFYSTMLYPVYSSVVDGTSPLILWDYRVVWCCMWMNNHGKTELWASTTARPLAANFKRHVFVIAPWVCPTATSASFFMGKNWVVVVLQMWGKRGQHVERWSLTMLDSTSRQPRRILSGAAAPILTVQRAASRDRFLRHAAAVPHLVRPRRGERSRWGGTLPTSMLEGGGVLHSQFSELERQKTTLESLFFNTPV